MAPEGGCQGSGGTARVRAEGGGEARENEGEERAGAASRTWEILASLAGVGEREITARRERAGRAEPRRW